MKAKQCMKHVEDELNERQAWMGEITEIEEWLRDTDSMLHATLTSSSSPKISVESCQVTLRATVLFDQHCHP